MLKAFAKFAAAAAAVAALMIGAGVQLVLAAALGVVLAVVILLHPLLGLALTIATNVMSPLIGKFDFSGVGLTIPRVFGALTVVSGVLWILAARERIRITPQFAALLSFVAVIGCSIAIMPDHKQSLVGAYMIGVGITMYFLVALLPRRRESLIGLVAVIWLVGFISGTIALVQYFAPSMEVLQTTEGGLDSYEGAVVDAESLKSGPIKRVTGGLGDANYLAFTLVTLLPLGLFWWRYPGSRPYRPWIALVIAVQLAGVGLSYSRSGVLALGCSMLYLFYKRRLPRWALLPGAAAALLGVLFLAPASFRERMFSLEYLKGGSTGYRKDILLDSIRIASDHWLMGIGYGQLGPMVYRFPQSKSAIEIAAQIDLNSPELHNTGAHNLWLEVWVEYGLLGLLPYCAFLVLIVRDLRRLERSGDRVQADLAIALLACMTAFFVCGMFGHVKVLKLFWLLAGAGAGLARLQQVAKRPAVGPAPDMQTAAVTAG